MNIEPGMAIRLRVLGVAALYLGLAAMVFFLAFCNLDGRLFWEDEAETALLAKNILKFGVPKVDDGVNHISVLGSQFDSRHDVWTWAPWLPEYITAGSFAIFGPTTWAGRAPFAFIGWLTVMLLGWVVWKIYRDHRVALASMLLLGTSEVFLLHIRQCRYYSLTVLAEVAFIYGIYEILARKRSGMWLVVAGLVIQFYCNFMITAANIPILLVMGVMLFRRDKRSVLPVVLSVAMLFLLSLPWLLFAEVWRQPEAEKIRSTCPHMFWFYVWQFHFHFLPWCVLLLPAWGWLRTHFKKTGEPPVDQSPGLTRRFERYLLFLPVFYVLVLLVLPDCFSRYLLPLLPAACVLAAAWLFRYIRKTAIAAILLIIQCASTVFAVASAPFINPVVRFPPVIFLLGALQPYDDRLSDVIKFLKPQLHPGDVLVSWEPELPLAFYTPARVVDVQMTELPPGRLPDWILPGSVSSPVDVPPVALPDLFKPYYEKIVLNVHNSARLGCLPEPESYEYESAKAMSPFVIYKLKESAAPSAAMAPARP